MKYFSLALCALAFAGCAQMTPVEWPFEVAEIPASGETAPMIGRGDRADDPVVWVHSGDGSKSRILGTNKETGLYVYDLAGNEFQFLDVGRVNNVDVRGDLAVASNDEVNGLSWFAIDSETGDVSHLGDTPVEPTEPYGVCAGLIGGTYMAAPTYKTGLIEFWAATRGEDGSVSTELVRTVTLPSQLEGCVFDDEASRVFIGEEEFGIYSLDLSDPDSVPVIVDTIAAGNGLVADVEGLTLWKGEGGRGYLIASAQAADQFVVYERQPPHAPVGIFSVVGSENGEIDGVTHTDGLDVTSAALPGYPKGLVVVQDDGNPASGVDQNFKLVDWARIADALALD